MSLEVFFEKTFDEIFSVPLLKKKSVRKVAYNKWKTSPQSSGAYWSCVAAVYNLDNTAIFRNNPGTEKWDSALDS